MANTSRQTMERRRQNAAEAEARAQASRAAAPTAVEDEPLEWWPWALRWIAVVAFLGAELVHWTVIDSHRAEWAAAGTFFLVLTTVEALLTFALIVSMHRVVLIAAIVSNVVPITIWAWDRTLGLPFGPQAGQRGQVGRADVISVILELVTIAALVPFLRRDLSRHLAQGPTRRGVFTVALVGTYVAFVVGYAALGESGQIHGATHDTTASTVPVTTAAVVVPTTVLVPTNEVQILAKDFSFEMPDTLPPEVTRLHMANVGNEPHELILAKLGAGVAPDELPEDVFVELLFAKSDVTRIAATGDVDPGRSEDLIVDLTPGKYVVACNLPSADGSFHYLKGMAKFLTVEAAPGASATGS